MDASKLPQGPVKYQHHQGIEAIIHGRCTPDMVVVAMRALLANKLADLPRPADAETHGNAGKR